MSDEFLLYELNKLFLISALKIHKDIEYLMLLNFAEISNHNNQE